MREIGKIDGGAIAVACAPDDLACDEVSLELDSPRSAIALMQPPSERARPRSARRRSVDAARPELTRFSARRARARGSANDASNNPRNAIGSVSVDTGLCLMDARDDDPTSPKIGNPEMGYAQLMPLVLHALSRLRCVPARVPAACLQPSALPRFSCYFFFPEPLSFFCRATPAPPPRPDAAPSAAATIETQDGGVEVVRGRAGEPVRVVQAAQAPERARGAAVAVAETARAHRSRPRGALARGLSWTRRGRQPDRKRVCLQYQQRGKNHRRLPAAVTGRLADRARGGVRRARARARVHPGADQRARYGAAR